MSCLLFSESRAVRVISFRRGEARRAAFFWGAVWFARPHRWVNEAAGPVVKSGHVGCYPRRG